MHNLNLHLAAITGAIVKEDPSQAFYDEFGFAFRVSHEKHIPADRHLHEGGCPDDGAEPASVTSNA